jgi:hypothetical protein
MFNAKMAESGFNSTDQRHFGFKLLTGKRIAAIAENFKERAGILIPYFEFSGRQLTDYCRVRYLQEPSGFDRLIATQKYVQPIGTPPRAYLPSCVPWKDVIKGNEPIILTEGEFKAACAAKHGYNAIGLGGVYAWKSKRLGVAFLPELAKIDWKERPVYLIFDSDIHWKPPVRQALIALADELVLQGAKPFQVLLPSISNGKAGLDDFIVSEGVEALEPLIEDATEYALSRELWKFSEEVAWVKDPGVMVKLSNGQQMTYNAFLQAHYVNRSIDVIKTNANGESRVVQKPLAEVWFKWPHRTALNSIVYEPGKHKITEDGGFNLWKGWGIVPKRGSVELWRRLINHLFANDKVKIKWFEQWCAIQLQQPGVKLYSAAFIWGRYQGTGKSLVGYTLGRIFGENFSEIHTDDIFSKYNAWASHTQFVLGDEIGAYSGVTNDRRLAGNSLKRLITRETVRMNQKYLPEIVFRDCINYLFTSNHADAFYIEPGDRRFFVHEVVRKPLPQSFYQDYDRWFKGEGAAHLFYSLLKVDLKGFDPCAPAFVTEDKAEMIKLSASDLDAWLMELKENPYGSFAAMHIEDPSELWTAEQLKYLYDSDNRLKLSVNGMARALKRNGFPNVGGSQGATTTRDGVRRLYAIINPDRWQSANLRDISEHYSKHFPKFEQQGSKY